MANLAEEGKLPEVLKAIGLDIVNNTDRKEDQERSEAARAVVEKRHPLKVFLSADAPTSPLSFFESHTRLNYCFATASKQSVSTVVIASFSKADGKRKSLNVCECDGLVTASSLTLLNLNGDQRLSLLVGLNHGVLLLFHFGDFYHQMSLKLLEGSIKHIAGVGSNWEWAQKHRNLVLVCGSDQSVYLVSCHKRLLVVAQFRQTNFEHVSPVCVFATEDMIVHAFEDGHINFWQVSSEVKKKAQEAHSIAKVQHFKRARMMAPKHSLQCVSHERLVAVAPFGDMLLVLSVDGLLMALQMDQTLPECYLTVFEYRLACPSPPSSMQLFQKEQYLLVACGNSITQLAFDKQGVYSAAAYQIDGQQASDDRISQFFVDEEQQRFVGGAVNGKFFIAQLAGSLRTNLKE